MKDNNGDDFDFSNAPSIPYDHSEDTVSILRRALEKAQREIYLNQIMMEFFIRDLPMPKDTDNEG